MYIEKIIIKNFKCFEDFSLNLNKELNILVGDNETGKSTILEAINLALSGWINGKYLKYELKQSLFNNKVIKKYLKSINEKKATDLPPSIVIELYCNFNIEFINEEFKGSGNSLRDFNSSGIRFVISFDEEKCSEYIKNLVNSGESISSLPIEYCEFSWQAFSRKTKIPRTIPLKSALIDSSSFRYKSGSDIGVSNIIRDKLTLEESAKISQAHRNLKDEFSKNKYVEEINEKLRKDISDKRLSLEVEMSTKEGWESSFIPHLNEIPFQNIGKGEQCLIKTKLALKNKKTEESNILLLEEPENHLSYTKLNELISYIKDNNEGKQVIVSTHSSFVANKLGLDKLLLLNLDMSTQQIKELRIEKLPLSTQEYFEKLPGYDTLRFILCKKAILVEGGSDELVVKKAYLKEKKKLPIEDGLDVISVRSLAFPRFLDIAKELSQPTIVITDNDGDYKKNIEEKYKSYKEEYINIFYDKNIDLPTLENQIVDANKSNLEILRDIFGIKKEKYPDEKSLVEYMSNNKTECALSILKTDKNMEFPKYIVDSINS